MRLILVVISFLPGFFYALGIAAQTFMLQGADTVKISEQNIDSSRLQPVLGSWLIEQIENGYLFATIDSVYSAQEKILIKTYSGSQYQWKSMNLIVDTDTITYRRNQLGFLKKELKELINNGYPFTSISLKELKVAQKNITGFWQLERGPFIEYDTLVLLDPSIPVRKEYLHRFLEIPIGEPYSEKRYQNIRSRLDSSPFLSLNSPPDIGFEGGKATIYLDLSYRESSSFDGVVGLNQSRNGNTIFTGYLDLDLQNLFKSGKVLQLNWQRFAEQSQQLSIRYNHPYFIGSKLGVNAGFSLTRQDTTFLTRQFNAGISSEPLEKIKLSFGYEFQGSQVNSEPDEESPSFRSFSSNWYQLQIGRRTGRSGELNNVANINLIAGLGQRKLSSSIADSIPKKSTSFRASFLYEQQMILRKKATFYFSSQVNYLQNPNLFQNELLRLGGFRSFRGFNEKQFFLNGYAYQNHEIRYFIEQESYLFALYDVGYLSNSLTKSLDGWYDALGFGLALKSENGLFSIIFANGSRWGDPLSIENTKVHFGYSAVF